MGSNGTSPPALAVSIALLCTAAGACGGLASTEAAAADATVDASPRPESGAGVDAYREAAPEASVVPTEGSTDGTVLDVNTLACPVSYGVTGTCSTVSLQCQYPQGNCWCLAGTECSGTRSCQEMGIECGPAGDGFGGLLQCGTCRAAQTCSLGHCVGAATDGGADACVPRNCGTSECNAPTDDGCGHRLICGSGCDWFCVDAGPGCPRGEPLGDASCGSDGQACAYPTPGCSCGSDSTPPAVVTYTCTAGRWASRSCTK